MLERGDVVKLKEPYTPLDRDTSFVRGVIAEIISTNPAGSGGGAIPRTVPLFLFNPTTRETYLDGAPGECGVPTFVDELVLTQKHDETYNPQRIDVGEIVEVKS